MNPASRTLVFTTATLLAAGGAVAQNAVFNNNGGSGLWSDVNNWNGGLIGDNGEIAQINPAAAEVDGNFTIKRLQNSFGSQFPQTISGAGTLTVDANAGGTPQAIVNVAGAGGGTMVIDTNVVIDNSGAGFSQIRNNNSSGNILTLGSNSTLTLVTGAEVAQGAGGSINFDGSIAGNGNLRLIHNNVSFGATSDNPSHTGEMVFQGNTQVTVDTAAGNTFFGGAKFQVNGNATLTLNNENVIANTPLIGFGGTPTFNLNVNADQAFGNLALNSGIVDLTLGAGVDDLDFLPSSAFGWTGSLNINNFTPGVVGFGFDGGLSAAQLGLITIDGLAPASPLLLDVDGKLVFDAVSVLEGDYDDSGSVGQTDLNAVLLNWGDVSFPGNAAAIPGGSFDGVISQNELNGVLLNWGNTAEAAGSAVPEPTTAALLGLAGLAGLARRHRI